MAAFIGLLSFEGARSGEDRLAAAKVARSLTELHGGRFLSIYWTDGEPDMVLTFEGRNAEQAETVFRELERQQRARLRVLPARSEGEQEWALRTARG